MSTSTAGDQAGVQGRGTGSSGANGRTSALDGKGTTSGWMIKIILLGLVDALAISGLVIAIDHEAWGYATLLGITFLALNAIYLPRRYVPMKYLLPGLFFLAVFAIYPVLYTVYVSTTNFGDGFVLSKDQAIEQIQGQSVRQVEGATAYDVTPLAGSDGAFAGFGLYDPETGDVFLGTTDGLQPIEDDVETQELVTTGRTFIVSAGDLTGVRPGDLETLPGYPTDPDSYVIPGATEGSAITLSGGQAFEATSTRSYDPDTDSITDSQTGTVYTASEGQFVSESGEALQPGFKTSVGFDNYTEVLTGSEFQSDFVRVLVWNFAYAILTVATGFTLGLLLAMVFNDLRMRGRTIYRSLLIIPYALPGFMTMLVWRGMFNRTYGLNSWFGWNVPWLEETSLAMMSIILVNLWLGFGYFMLITTGALQSIPTDLKEAANVDGATGFTTFRRITFPLLLTAVSPLLVASFAYNFNSFTTIYLLTDGGPREAGASAGNTDILISWTYRLALIETPKQQGLAAAVSVMIFLIVAVVSALGFKFTKTFEEVR